MDKKVLTGLLLFLILLIALPLILLQVKQQQTYNQHAATGNYPNMDVCGNLVAISNVTENPSCVTGGKPVSSTSFSQYSTEVTVQNQGKNSGSTPLTVTFTWEKYWCNYIAKDSSGKQLWVCGGPDDPNHNATTHAQETKTVTLNKGDTVTLKSGINQAQQACGTFQNDLTFSYSYSGKNCGPGNPSTGVRFQTMNWGFCQTANATCTFTPTNTPTQGVTPPTNTPTTGVTETPTETPTIAITDTPTDSPTDVPSASPTDTPPPGSTPTPTPTTPPGSTPTPTTPVVSTPKPTLPPTGPGDTIFGVGLAGVAIALIGVIFVLAF